MFNFLKKKSRVASLEIFAPVDGKLMPIIDVKDEVFSTKMLGDGFVINPSNGNIYAPVSGRISTFFSTKHAVGIKTKEGLEVLIHLGLETVDFKGEPFNIKVKQGDIVKQGDELLTMNIQQITNAGYDDSVIVVYANMGILRDVTPIEKGKIAHCKKVQTVYFK